MYPPLLPLHFQQDGEPYVVFGPSTPFPSLFLELLSTIHLVFGPYTEGEDLPLILTLCEHLRKHHALDHITLFVDNSIWQDAFKNEVLKVLSESFPTDNVHLTVKDRALEVQVTTLTERKPSGLVDATSEVELPLAAMSQVVVEDLVAVDTIRKLVLLPSSPLLDVFLPMQRLMPHAYILDGLKELTIPIDALSDAFLKDLNCTPIKTLNICRHASLASIDDLTPASDGTFEELETLNASDCTINDLCTVVVAVCPKGSKLRTLSVDTKQLTYSTEVHLLILILEERAPDLRSLSVHIAETHPMDTVLWDDLNQLLRRFSSLEYIDITHPDHPPLRRVPTPGGPFPDIRQQHTGEPSASMSTGLSPSDPFQMGSGDGDRSCALRPLLAIAEEEEDAILPVFEL